MSGKKSIVMLLILFILITFGLIANVWDYSYAQTDGTTIPTSPPGGPMPSATPVPNDGGESVCISGTIAKDKQLDLNITQLIQKKYPASWGGGFNPVGSACQQAREVVCQVAVRYLPNRGQLNFYRKGIEIRQYVGGKEDLTDSCAQKSVYFDLSGYERFMYEHFMARVGFYWYNPDTMIWETCPNISLDIKTGKYGRLSCDTTKWGFFALGWSPAP